MEAAVVMASVYCAHSVLEPPGAEPEAMDPAPVPAPNDAGTPAPAGRSVQVQEGAPGLRVAQQETPGPRVAQQETPRPRSAQ